MTSHSVVIATEASGLPGLRPPEAQIRVDLDDRCFLFPAAKNVSHMQLLIYRGKKLRLEVAFPYNASQSASEFLELGADAVPDFARKMVEAVYRAGSFLTIVDGLNISMCTHANGYNLQVGDFSTQRDLFVSPACIWRLCGAICRAGDFLAVKEAH